MMTDTFHSPSIIIVLPFRVDPLLQFDDFCIKEEIIALLLQDINN